MRVFFVPYAYPNTLNRTLCVYLKEQAEMFSRHGHEVIVLHARVLPSKYILKRKSRSIEILQDDFGIRRYLIDCKSLRGIRRFEYSQYQSSINALMDYAKDIEGDPDIIITNFALFSGYAAMNSPYFGKVPIVNIEHYGRLLDNSISSFERKCLQVTVDRANCFICVSDALRTAVGSIAHSKSPIYVVPNKIPVEYKYTPLESHRDSFLFLSVGNLYEAKGFRLLVESFAKVFRNNTSVKLRIVGDGPLRKELESFIDDNKLVDQVVLLGRLSREEILREYEGCNCFVLPSEHESFGIVYREAMAVGRPIITTDHQGFSDEWDDAWGIRVKRHESGELCSAMYTMYQEYSKFNPETISEACLKRYSEDRVYGELMRCIGKSVE